MANLKYAQVIDLLAAGDLKWPIDSIKAVLVRDATFEPLHERISDLQVPQVAIADINGRKLATGGSCFGFPAVFTKIAAGIDYQMLLVKDDGRNDPMTLAFFDSNNLDAPLTLVNNGTLIVRPSETDDEERPLGLWMNF